MDLPTNIGFLIFFLIFFFCFLNNLPNTGRCFVKKVAAQNCTENLSKNRSVILKIKGLSSDKERQILTDINMGGFSEVDLENGLVEEAEGAREGGTDGQTVRRARHREKCTVLACASLSAAKHEADPKEGRNLRGSQP